MTEPNRSVELSRETFRARAIRGGTTKCSRCDLPRVESSAYCREHRNEYQREWQACERAELKRLRQLHEAHE